MAQLQVEGESGTNLQSESSLPTIEQWVQQGKITENLYNNLHNGDPKWTVELLLLMTQNDIKDLRKELTNVKIVEIFQLINLLKKIPQSQIHQNLENDSQKKTNRLLNHKTAQYNQRHKQ